MFKFEKVGKMRIGIKIPSFLSIVVETHEFFFFPSHILIEIKNPYSRWVVVECENAYRFNKGTLKSGMRIPLK
jgi:hypothetical protein